MSETRLTPEERYWQALRKARLQGARSMRRWREGLEPFAECIADLERDALIKEIGRHELRALIKDDRP